MNKFDFNCFETRIDINEIEYSPVKSWTHEPTNCAESTAHLDLSLVLYLHIFFAAAMYRSLNSIFGHWLFISRIAADLWPLSLAQCLAFVKTVLNNVFDIICAFIIGCEAFIVGCEFLFYVMYIFIYMLMSILFLHKFIGIVMGSAKHDCFVIRGIYGQ